MTQPAKRNHHDKVARSLKKQSWILLILILLATIVDFSYSHASLALGKSIAMGGLLSFMGQVIFALFVFRHTGYRARRHIVQQLYRGQMAKWLITLSGFALIFITIQPLSAPALFIGFIVMQISHSLILWQLH